MTRLIALAVTVAAGAWGIRRMLDALADARLEALDEPDPTALLETEEGLFTPMAAWVDWDAFFERLNGEAKECNA